MILVLTNEHQVIRAGAADMSTDVTKRRYICSVAARMATYEQGSEQ